MSRHEHEGPQRKTVAALAAALLLAAPAVALAGDFEPHELGYCAVTDGLFTSQIDPVDCPSPVGFCTVGDLQGDIEGTYYFVMTDSVPAPTAEHPTREVFTGYSTITTASGVMYGDDHGEIWFDGTPGFITYVGVYAGDECFDKAHGYVLATGELDLATGFSIGTYESEICHATQCFVRADVVDEVL